MANTLRYPYEDPGDYKGSIVFKVVNEEAIRQATQDSIVEGVTAGVNALDGTVEEIVTGVKSTEGAPPSVIASQEREAAKKTTKEFKKVTNVSKTVSNTSIADDISLLTKNTPDCPYVQLYLPTAFQVQDAVEFENFDLGLAGAGVERALKDGASVGGAALSGLKKGFEALSDLPAIAGQTLNVTNESASLIAASVAKKAGNLGAETAGAIRSVTGVQLNPNTRALFKSVPLRSFNFNFVMIPTSKAEAEQVKNIVRHFREELYPVGLDLAGINYGYKFPNRFVIETKYNDRTIPGLKFLPAYLTGVSTTYNTQGMSFHSDGNFSSTSITLNFTESKALMKQHIQANF